MSQPGIVSADILSNFAVYNQAGEMLGQIKELMVDLVSGHIVYIVLSFHGATAASNKLFAIPWHILSVDIDSHACILNIDSNQFDQAPNFNHRNWLSQAEYQSVRQVYRYSQSNL